MIRDAGPTLTGRAVRVDGRVAPAFLAQHALSPADAIAFTPPERDARAFARMVATGQVREAEPGRWWLDLPRTQAIQAAGARRRAPIAMVAAVLVATVALLFYRG